MGDIMTYAWKSASEMEKEILSILKDSPVDIKKMSREMFERWMTKAYYEILGTGISRQQLTVSDKQRSMFFEAENRVRQKLFGVRIGCYMREDALNKFNIASLLGMRQ